MVGFVKVKNKITPKIINDMFKLSKLTHNFRHNIEILLQTM